MRKLLLLCGVLLLASCDSKDSKIKSALKESAEVDGLEYELTDYRLVEDIYKQDLLDSAKRCLLDTLYQHSMIEFHENEIEKCDMEIRSCKAYGRRFAIGGFYDVAKTWQDMKTEHLEKARGFYNEIDSIKARSKRFEMQANQAKDGVVIYSKYIHNYTLNGVSRSKIVLLTPEYKIYENHED